MYKSILQWQSLVAKSFNFARGALLGKKSSEITSELGEYYGLQIKMRSQHLEIEVFPWDEIPGLVNLRRRGRLFV